MTFPMKIPLRSTLLTLFLPVTFLATHAFAETVAAPGADEALHRAVIGTWLYEQNAGIASVAMYTTYREDGSAIQLIKTKFMLKKATGVWIENRWSIQNGALHLTTLRFRAHNEDAKIDLGESVRQLLSVDDREMRYQLRDKERKEAKAAGLPDDVQKMIDELSKK